MPGAGGPTSDPGKDGGQGARRGKTQTARRKVGGIGNGQPGGGGGAIKVCFVTREYPPHVYGGAGVHIANLARELARVKE